MEVQLKRLNFLDMPLLTLTKIFLNLKEPVIHYHQNGNVIQFFYQEQH